MNNHLLHSNKCALSRKTRGQFNMAAEDSAGWHCRICTYINRATIIRCEMCFCPRDEDTTPITTNEKSKLPENRIILIGKTGTGKSATGNTILGKKYFKSESSSSSVTCACRLGKCHRFGRRLAVVDTPGLFDTGMSNDSVTTEILKCVGLSAPGPHAIIIVVQVGRFTEEEREAITLLQRMFGFGMTKFSIIVFTRKDDLLRSKKTIADLIVEAPDALAWVLQCCEYRCIAFDNFADEGEKEQQTLKLLSIIDEVMENNNHGYYTSSMFSESEACLQETEREILQENDKRAKEHLSSYKTKLYKECITKIEKNQELEQQYKNELKALRRRQDQIMNAYSCTENEMIDTGEQEKEGVELHLQISDLEKKLIELRKEQRNLYDAADDKYLEQEKRVQFKLKELENNVRDDVCMKLENGDLGMLRRMFQRLTQAGNGIADRFKYVFEALAQRIRKRDEKKN